MHSAITNAAGNVQVVAKPHQRGCTTQQEACLLCVTVGCVTSNYILKLRRESLPHVFCDLFWLLLKMSTLWQLCTMAREGAMPPGGLILPEKSVETGREEGQEVECYLTALPLVKPLFD